MKALGHRCLDCRFRLRPCHEKPIIQVGREADALFADTAEDVFR